jgi:hypothetical protein
MKVKIKEQFFDSSKALAGTWLYLSEKLIFNKGELSLSLLISLCPLKL